VASCRTGLVEGDLVERRDNILVLSHAVIRGTKNIAHMERLLLFVAKDNIAHIHSVPTRVEPVVVEQRREP
jgi:hypothetical protein